MDIKNMVTAVNKKIELYSYQKECIEALFASMHQGNEFSLAVLPTAAGKTIIFSRFVEEVFRRYGHRMPVRVAIIMHRETLVRQTHEKLVRVWPESVHRLGLACASYKDDIDVDSDIVIGSIQTIMSRLRKGHIKPFNVILIDEGHRIPHKGGMYNHFLDYTGTISPKRKVLAFTATPFQLGHGYMYGDQCHPEHKNRFALAYSIGMEDLVNMGKLVPCRIKQAVDIGPELRGIPFSNGDYQKKALGNIMCKFVKAAVDVYKKYGENRSMCAAFCSSIGHADALAAAFSAEGIPAVSLHSKLPEEEKERRKKLFSEGKAKVAASVDMLSEGWDETGVDLILLLRPTMSPMVYVQQVGRGMRLHPGKKDVLVLDCADAVARHGLPSAPVVVVPGHSGKGEAPVKLCPECDFALHASIMTCKECGYVFPRKQYREPATLTLEEVETLYRKYTRACPALVKVSRVDVFKDYGRIRMVLTFTDPVTHKRQHGWYFFHQNNMDHHRFAEEWESVTNMSQTPKNIDEAYDMLRSVEWPRQAFFHKENKARLASLCGWKHKDWDGIFPEIHYQKEQFCGTIRNAHR